MCVYVAGGRWAEDSGGSMMQQRREEGARKKKKRRTRPDEPLRARRVISELRLYARAFNYGCTPPRGAGAARQKEEEEEDGGRGSWLIETRAQAL